MAPISRKSALFARSFSRSLIRLARPSLHRCSAQIGFWKSRQSQCWTRSCKEERSASERRGAEVDDVRDEKSDLVTAAMKPANKASTADASAGARAARD